MRHMTMLLMLAVLLAVFGCQRREDALATSPAETAIEPRQVVAGSATGQQVAWGGTLIRVENLRDRTRLEVLAYPLDRDGVPRINEQPTGRFLADHWGFLDPGDYTPGRRVTVRGTITGSESGKVGDAAYVYPRVEAVDTRLWQSVTATQGSGWWPPQLHIGIGVYGGF